MKNHKSQIRASRTPSSSSDEILFVNLNKKSLVQNNGVDGSYESLHIQKLVTCEFCEEVFLNRYDHIVHNAYHIIIPLSKDNVLRCRECSEQCISHRKLRKHMKKKHPDAKIIHHYDKEFNTTVDETISESQSEITLTLESENVKQESDIANVKPAIVNDKTLVITLDSNRRCELISSSKEVEDENKVIEISDSDDDIGVKENGDLKIVIKKENNNVSDVKKKIQSIRDRLMFEEDILGPESPDDKASNLIQDLTSEYKINMDLEPPWRALDVEDKSVHYEELVSPSKVKCRLCMRGFPNRYKAILHETSHIEIKKHQPYLCRYCDWYISDNVGYLNMHIRKKHTGYNQRQDSDEEGTKHKTKQKMQVTKCEKCNLNYVCYEKHTNNYHRDSIMVKENDKLLPHTKNEHVEQDGGEQDWALPVGYHTKIEKICKFCCSFLKDKSNSCFMIIGEHCEVGTRLRCDKCGREFFELKLVKRRTKFRIGHKMGPKVKKTNYDRLKNIQNRFKMMKNL